jgi:hypothetical protein
MTAGQKTAERAAKYVGVTEVPLGSNTGPQVSQWQRPWGMGTGWPWCGAYAAAMTAYGVTGNEAKVHDTRLGNPPIGHPSTAIMAQRAKDQGAVIPHPIPGSFLIWPGRHVEVCADYSADGRTVVTYGGNTGDSVRRQVRAYGKGTGTIIAAAPAIRQGATSAPRGGRRYYVEDVGAAKRTKFYGPWRLRAWRERVIARLPAATRARVRRVRVGNKYGYEIGPRRVYGPWSSAAMRDNAAQLLANRLGRQVRRFSLPPAKTSTGASASSLGKTT